MRSGVTTTSSSRSTPTVSMILATWTPCSADSTRANVVIGARFDGDSHYRVGRSRRLAISILSRRLSGMTRTRLTDVTSGFRAADRAADRALRAHLPRGVPRRHDRVAGHRRQGGIAGRAGVRPDAPAPWRRPHPGALEVVHAPGPRPGCAGHVNRAGAAPTPGPTREAAQSPRRAALPGTLPGSPGRGILR